MTSKFHQMIIGIIGRKMREQGYEIIAFDGNDFLFDGQKLKVPPCIKRHKPDIVGFKFETKEVCIGEAKTRNDLFSKRTTEQLLDYSSTKGKSTEKTINIIIGIPKSAETDLKILLNKLKLRGKNSISYVWLPDEFVDEI